MVHAFKVSFKQTCIVRLWLLRLVWAIKGLQIRGWYPATLGLTVTEPPTYRERKEFKRRPNTLGYVVNVVSVLYICMT